jgi:hypothetical protein
MTPKHLLPLCLIICVGWPGLLTIDAQTQDRPCWDSWDSACTVTSVQIGVGVLRAGLGLLPAPPVCEMTPSTGLGSGVNVRALPDIDSDIIGDIALGDYREVTALSADWVQTVTRNGDTGFVAARVAALVGPCGDVPRFVVTP